MSENERKLTIAGKLPLSLTRDENVVFVSQRPQHHLVKIVARKAERIFFSIISTKKTSAAHGKYFIFYFWMSKSDEEEKFFFMMTSPQTLCHGALAWKAFKCIIIINYLVI